MGEIWKIVSGNNTLINKAIVFASSSIFRAGNAYYRRGYNKSIKEVDTVFGGCYKKEIFEKIRTLFPMVQLTINDRKKGFAENHNNVIEKTTGKYILILNDDTVILDNAIEKLVNYMDKHSEVGIIGPKLLNPDLSLQQSTYSFPTLLKVSLNLFGIRKMVPLY